MAKIGRPRRVIDYALVEQLAEDQNTQEEIASKIGFSYHGFAKRRGSDDLLVAALKKGYDSGKRSLRRLQWDTARAGGKGAVTMQIWLGKQYLKQRDRSEVTQKEVLGVEEMTDGQLAAVIGEGAKGSKPAEPVPVKSTGDATDVAGKQGGDNDAQDNL